MNNIEKMRIWLTYGWAILALLIGALGVSAKAEAQTQKLCTPVESFAHKRDFQRSKNLPELISRLLGPDKTPEALSRLTSNSQLAAHIINNPSWIELGDITQTEVVEDAFEKVREGKIVVAFKLTPDKSRTQIALVSGTQLHSSSSWVGGTLAGVYYSPIPSRTFAGCKLSFIWRSPKDVKLFVYNAGSTGKLPIQNSTDNIIQPEPARPARTQSMPVKTPDYSGDPVYEADVILQNLKTKPSIETREFNFEGCVYMHGTKGWVGDWEHLNEAERVDLAAFLSKVPTRKIRSAGAPVQNSDQFVIGPLCDCKSYEKTVKLVETYNFEVLGILRDENHMLKNCLR